MKQLIVLSAILPILLVIMLQFSHEQEKHSRNMATEQAMHEFRIKSSLDYDSLNSEVASLKSKLAQIYKMPQNSIGFEITPSGTQIKSSYYKITIPITKIMTGIELMQIGNNKNQAVRVLTGEIIPIEPPPIPQPPLPEENTEVTEEDDNED